MKDRPPRIGVVRVAADALQQAPLEASVLALLKHLDENADAHGEPYRLGREPIHESGLAIELPRTVKQNTASTARK